MAHLKNLNVEIETLDKTDPINEPHNSLFDVFKNKCQYDYLIPIDSTISSIHFFNRNYWKNYHLLQIS